MDDEAVKAEVSSPEAQAPEMEQAAEEKMIPASRVEELIKKAKLKGRDAMQDELEALRSENQKLKTMGGMVDPVDTEAMRKQVYDQVMQQFETQKTEQAQKELEAEARKLAQDYQTRMSSGSELHEDFDDVMADFNPSAFPQLVYLATQTENTPSVMYELMKNPNKLATIAILSERDPNAAQSMINKLSASIKANEQAKAAEKEVQSPLSRMQSSPTGRDSGELTIADYKRMFRR